MLMLTVLPLLPLPDRKLGGEGDHELITRVFFRGAMPYPNRFWLQDSIRGIRSRHCSYRTAPQRKDSLTRYTLFVCGRSAGMSMKTQFSLCRCPSRPPIRPTLFPSPVGLAWGGVCVTALLLVRVRIVPSVRDKYNIVQAVRHTRLVPCKKDDDSSLRRVVTLHTWPELRQ